MQIALHNIIPCYHGNDKTEELCRDMWSGENSEKNSSSKETKMAVNSFTSGGQDKISWNCRPAREKG